MPVSDTERIKISYLLAEFLSSFYVLALIVEWQTKYITDKRLHDVSALFHVHLSFLNNMILAQSMPMTQISPSSPAITSSFRSIARISHAALKVSHHLLAQLRLQHMKSFNS